MYVGTALSLLVVPIMRHYIGGMNNIVDELRYQAVLVFIVVICCHYFTMAKTPSAAKPTSCLIPVLLSSGLARNGRT